MKVILLQDVAGVGRKDEIHDVRSGYARNALLPMRAAILASGAALLNHQQRRATQQAITKEQSEALQRLAQRLPTVRLELPQRANDKGDLYGSVHPRTIVDSLVQQGIAVPEHAISLDKPITHIGEYQIPVQLSAQLRAIFSLIITAA